MAELHYTATLNIDQMKASLEEMARKVRSFGKESADGFKDIEKALGDIKNIGSIDEAWQRLDAALESNKKAMREILEKMKEVKGVSEQATTAKEYEQYKEQYDQLEKLLKVRQELQKEIYATGDALSEEENKTVSLRKELREAEEAYRNLRLAQQRGVLIDENKLEQAAKRVKELKDLLGETGKELKEGIVFKGTIEGLQGLTGAFSTAQGVIGLFNSKSEEMQAIMTKVQSLMAIMMGVQQIQNMLLKDSAFRVGVITKLQQWFAGVTVKVTAATTAQTAATTGLAGAFKALSIAVKSVPGIGWFLAGVAALITLIRSLTEETRKAKEMQDNLFNGAVQQAAGPIAKIEELSYAYRQLRTDAQKLDFIQKHAQDFRDLGVAIDSVADAENALSANTERWKKAEILKGIATAARKELEENFSSVIKAQRDLENYEINDFVGVPVIGALFGISDAIKLRNNAKTVKQGDATKNYLLSIIGAANKASDVLMKGFKNAGEEAVVQVDGSIGKLEERIAQLQRKYKSAKTDHEREMLKDEMSGYQKELDRLTGKKNDILKKSGIDPTEVAIKKIEGQKEVIDQMRDFYGQYLELSGDSKAALEKTKELFDGFVELPAGMDEATAIAGDYVSILQSLIAELEKLDGDKAKETISQINEAIRSYNVSSALNTASQDSKVKKDKEKYLKEDEEAMYEFTIQYGTEEQKRLAITEKYEKLIAEAIAKGQENKAKLLRNKLQDELSTISWLENTDLQKIFSDPSGLSEGTLRENLKQAHALIADLTKDWGNVEKGERKNVEQVKELQEQIDKIQEALLEVEDMDWGFSSQEAVSSLSNMISLQQKSQKLREQAEELRKTGKEQDEDEAKSLDKQADSLSEKSKKIWENLKKNRVPLAVNTIANGFAKAAEFASQLAEITGDVSLQDWADSASALAQNFQAAGQGAASGGWIGAIVGGVSDMAQQTMNAFLEAKAWVKQFEASINDFHNAIELADLVFNGDKFTDMFGTRSLESAVEAYRAMNDLSAKYNEQVTAAFELGEREKRMANAGKGFFLGTWFKFTKKEGFTQKTTQKWYSELDAYQRGLNKLQAIQVKVKHASGWAKLWGKESKYQSLFDVAPELWGGDINGEFDVEKAKKFLETSKQLTDEQRKQLELAIQYKEEWDKAQEALENVISDTVGSFADDMADAVWEAITTGANAWDVFREKGNEALVALGKQMLKEFAINTYLEAFKDKLKAAYGSGDTNALAKIYTEIFDGMPMVLENMTIAGEQWVQMLKDNGYDITEEKGATNGSTGGYQTAMSHEDASEVNGRLTDIQMQMRIGVASISSIQSHTDAIRSQAVQAVDHLYRIERNTAMLSSIDGRLQKIERNTANL